MASPAINCCGLTPRRVQDPQHTRNLNLLGRTAGDYTLRLNGLQEHALCQQRVNQRLQHGRAERAYFWPERQTDHGACSAR